MIKDGDMPVYSTTEPPTARRSPASSAIRSFMLPVGFGRMRTPFLGTNLAQRQERSVAVALKSVPQQNAYAVCAFSFGSLAPSTSIGSITGGAANKCGAWAIRALAIGPLR
jgi:hypothetical protein